MSLSDNVYIIGLTGQSGAGKSTVSKIFSQNGLPVIDADCISREVSRGEDFLKETAELFPDCVAGGKLDRRKLASIVFNDPQKLLSYTNIIYPYITKAVFSEIKRLKEQANTVIILDAPTLFESGLDDICAAVVSVIAPMELKIKRILERDNIPVELVYSRLGSQNSEEYFKSRSDYVIENDSDLDSLKEKTLDIIAKLAKRFEQQRL